MPKITFIAHNGTRNNIEATSGQSLMNAAINNNIRGIDGDCGGQCGCATCHIYIDLPWAGLIPSPQPNEDEMLNFTGERLPTSRLACQVQISDGLDGMEVRLPIGQH